MARTTIISCYHNNYVIQYSTWGKWYFTCITCCFMFS